MAKDKKAKAAQKKARVSAKTEKKAAQKEKKSKTKSRPGDNDDSDSSDGDLDSILASYAAAQEQFHKISETVIASPPPPRSSGTVLANPSDAREILFFGGESLSAGLASFSNALHTYRPATDQWRLVTSPNSPLPRSGHAWCRGGNNALVYLFGGEFSSPKQGTFHHYNDFWSLDPSTREWTRLEGKVGPSARSGHRMVAWRRYVLLFGGFQDTSASTRYLGDLWVYDTVNYSWHEPKLATAMARPDARSSFSFLPHESGAVIVGGYSRVKTVAKGKGGGAGKAVVKPVVHQDCWLLRIVEPGKDEGERALPSVRWERRKKPVNMPVPARAGATMAHHKGRGIMFGGVHDVEESEEGIESEFFNQLWAYNIERNRFFPLGLRRPRAAAKKVAVQDRARRGRGRADEEELLKNLALIENKGTLDDDGDVVMEQPAARAASEDEEPAAAEKPIIYEMPHPRFNAQLAVQDDALCIYGGTFEKGDKEFTFDELWSIDLGKMDGAKELFRREIEDWAGDESSEDEDDEDDEEEDEDAMDEDEDAADKNGTESEKPPGKDSKQTEDAIKPPAADAGELEEEEKEVKTSKDDGLPYPRPFESLRDFNARTTTDWQNICITQSKIGTSAMAQDKGAKEIKKEAFDRAEQRWWDVREEIQALEDEREEGGIGEVVQLGDRAGDGTGAGRRR